MTEQTITDAELAELDTFMAHLLSLPAAPILDGMGAGFRQPPTVASIVVTGRGGKRKAKSNKITIRLTPWVLRAFRAHAEQKGQGYQTAINAALRAQALSWIAPALSAL